MGSLLLPTAVAIAVGVGCRGGSENHEPSPSIETPNLKGPDGSQDGSEVKPFKLANPVSDQNLLDALASSDGGAWREAIIRLAHKMPAPASALNTMVGRSEELDQRIEKLLSLALFFTTSIGQLEKHIRLRDLAARRIEEARKFLVGNPPPRPDGDPEPMFTPEDSLPPKESAVKFGGFAVPVHVATALLSKSAQTKAAALLSLERATAARPAVAILISDRTKVSENNGCYYSKSSIGAYAARVGKNRWEKYITFEVEDYVRTLEELDAPTDRLSTLINALRSQGTLDVNGWDKWWERARPLWNEWWRLKDAKPNVTREELLKLWRNYSPSLVGKREAGTSAVSF
jgi:hypothetical protein